MTIQSKPDIRTGTEFHRQVLEQDRPVLVLFAGSRCGRSCRMEEVLKSLSPSWNDRIAIHKIDVGVSTSIATEFGVHATPVLIFFRNGTEEHRFLGSVPLEHLEQTLFRLLP